MEKQERLTDIKKGIVITEDYKRISEIIKKTRRAMKLYKEAKALIDKCNPNKKTNRNKRIATYGI